MSELLDDEPLDDAQSGLTASYNCGPQRWFDWVERGNSPAIHAVSIPRLVTESGNDDAKCGSAPRRIREERSG